jgi:hypothetical protein
MTIINKARILEIANIMTITITFILESAKAHNKYYRSPCLLNINVGGHQTTQSEQGTASKILNEI